MNRSVLIRRLLGPAFLVLIGVNGLLAQLHILGWDKSWPLYLILAGVLQLFWCRGGRIGGVVLIALGLLFLLDQLYFLHGRIIEFTWPLALIALGVWLIVRRLVDSQGASK